MTEGALDELRAAMLRAFAVTGADTPGWPDPHPDRDPLQEEYSRCLDPGKYRIVAARAEAWVQAIVDAGLASVETDDVPTVDVDVSPEPTRVLALRPLRDSAQPIVVGLGTFPDSDGGGVALWFGDPGRSLGWWPTCGCDACDDGSESLLEELDDWFVRVVSGELIFIDLPGGGTITSYGQGMQGSNVPEGMFTAETIRRARAGEFPAVVGPAWFA